METKTSDQNPNGRPAKKDSMISLNSELFSWNDLASEFFDLQNNLQMGVLNEELSVYLQFSKK